jgi:hypothetical protein
MRPDNFEVENRLVTGKYQSASRAFNYSTPPSSEGSLEGAHCCLNGEETTCSRGLPSVSTIYGWVT